MTVATDLVNETLASPVRLVFIVIALLTTVLISLASRPAFNGKAPKTIQGNLPILGSLRFFQKRWEFFSTGIKNSPTGNFSYHLGKHPVVGVSGEESRKFFFEGKTLGFSEGYEVLFDAGPKADVDKSDKALDKGFSSYFSNRLIHMLKRDNLAKHMPDLLNDCRERLGELGTAGKTDPYESIYEIVFLLTMRMVGAREIAEDRTKLSKALGLFEDIEASSTPTGIIMPWLPIPAKLRRYLSGARLAMMFSPIINERKATGRREDDALQYLIDCGDGLKNIITFVLGALFAGQLNSGINAAAMLCHVADNPELKQQLFEEVKSVAAANCTDPKAPLLDQLKTLPLETWESGFPLVDLCLRESIRLHLSGTAFRRNISGQELAIKGSTEVVPAGAFVTYHMNDVHMNPNIYKDPNSYDPKRFLPDRAEDKKEAHAFVGWGSGRHPCLGMRFAKLEQNLICAHWVAMMEYELVDVKGDPTVSPPPDPNAWTASKPKEQLFMKYKRRTDV